MPPGRHNLKFVVDDEWKCSEDLPTASDPDGHLVNYIEINDEQGHGLGDGLDGLADFGPNDVGLSESPPSSYTCEIPNYVERGRSRFKRVQEDPSQPKPPALPVHLTKVILNSKSIPSQDAHFLNSPNHVSLNHLYACSIRDNVMAIGTTIRYRKKVN